ncbi:MAG: hypothetical protein KAV83_09085 [Desulfobacterales bacterium]|nr:hypothetical protein [Desulfobacterales bacterium]
MKLPKNLKPARQGDYDGACGFYSIGNALTCLLHKNISQEKLFEKIYESYFEILEPKQVF